MPLTAKTIHPLRYVFVYCEAENGARQKDPEGVWVGSKKDVFLRCWESVGEKGSKRHLGGFE